MHSWAPDRITRITRDKQGALKHIAKGKNMVNNLFMAYKDNKISFKFGISQSD